MKRLLHCVDFNNDFMCADGALSVPGAEALIPAVNQFFENVKEGAFDAALFTYDSHFSGEYPFSPESIPFPNIHCEYGTRGWQLAVKPGLLAGKMPVSYMTKNVFDMWGSNPVDADKRIEFKNEEERQAYRNLFHVTDDPDCLKPGMPRDEFLKDVGPDTDVVLVGVASNFCDADAMLGYLKKGANVTVLSDLVRGIPLGSEGQKAILNDTGIDRTATGDICDVLKTDRFRPYVENGQLRVETAADFLWRSSEPAVRSGMKGPQP